MYILSTSNLESTRTRHPPRASRATRIMSLFLPSRFLSCFSFRFYFARLTSFPYLKSIHPLLHKPLSLITRTEYAPSTLIHSHSFFRSAPLPLPFPSLSQSDLYAMPQPNHEPPASSISSPSSPANAKPVNHFVVPLSLPRCIYTSPTATLPYIGSSSTYKVQLSPHNSSSTRTLLSRQGCHRPGGASQW